MPDISKRIEKAEKYVRKGKIDDALEEYLLAFREDPTNDPLVEIIAELYARQGLPDKALECYGYLFDKHAERGDGPQSVLMFRKMARLGLPDPARELAAARFLEKQKPAEACDHYRSAAQHFLEGGEKARALEALRGAAALDERSADAHLQVAELAESLLQNEVAATAYMRAGQLLRATDPAGEKPLQLLERAGELAPADGQVAWALAGALFGTGNAKRAAELLEPFLSQGVMERNRLLAEAHLASGNLERAEEVLWAIAQQFPEAHGRLMRVAELLLEEKKPEAALNTMRRLKSAFFSAKKEKELLDWLEALGQKSAAGGVLELLAGIYAELGQDSPYSAAMARLFDLYFAAGDFAKAASTLERMAERLPDDPDHGKRLEQLTGKLDSDWYKKLAARFRPATAAASASDPWGGFAPTAGAGGADTPSGSVEDMMLQAEISLQFGQKEAAAQYLREALKASPDEETRNDRLRNLMVEAGLAPKPRPADAGDGRPQTGAIAAAMVAQLAQEPVADIARVSEITRNIYRQGTAKGVLSVSVNEIGRTWQASRCVAGLCLPGKPPSAALEWCTPGVKTSDVGSVVKLITEATQMTASGTPVALEDAASSPPLAGVAKALGIRSLLALPLMDAEQPAGVLVLEQCDQERHWGANEIVVLKTLVDQVAIAVSHVKLRSLMKVVGDERSGLLNRGSYLDCLLAESDRARQQNTPLSAALLRFAAPRAQETAGAVSPKSGAPAAEIPAAPTPAAAEALERFMKEAAQALAGQLRQNDIGVRYDASTLAVVLPNTKGQDAPVVVEKFRKGTTAIKVDGLPGIALAAGVAEAVVAGMDAADTVTELINRLESALEQAQREGGPLRLAPPPAR